MSAFVGRTSTPIPKAAPATTAQSALERARDRSAANTAIRAQAAMPQLQGQRNTYFCGAWMGYGFHEDGLKAGLGVARQLLVDAESEAVEAVDIEVAA